jgi:subtilisin-like proprotein convertase family protein
MKLIYMFFVLLSCSGLFAQVNLVNPDGTPAPGYQNPVIIEKGTQLSPGETITDRPNFQGNPRNNTDEYGSFSVNGVLAGLGAATKYVSVPHNVLFNQNFDGTAEMWIYPTNLTHGNTIIAKGATVATIGCYLGVNATSVYFRIGATFFTFTTPIVTDTWTHIAVTWSGGPAAFTVKLFVNGALINTLGPTAATWNLNTDPVIIGGNAAYPDGFFEGSIDEVRWWNPERTAAQIAENRFTGVGDGAGANASSALTSSLAYTGLVSSWTFNTGTSAYDDISGFNGTFNGGAGAFTTTAGRPIPYNLACLFSGGIDDYVTVPSNAAFNQSSNGTLEAWVYPTTQTTTHMLLSRGTTGFDLFWGIRQSIGNKQVLDIGAAQYANTDGAAIPLNKWTHIAAKWSLSGGSYTVTFYVNGQQSGTPVTLASAWTSTSGTLRIGGWHGGTANHFRGYMDEVRMWASAQTITQIRNNMLVSGRALLPNANLVGIWNFDGNLNNFSAITGINGSFVNAGTTNSSRFSGYSNESTTGAYSGNFNAHTTVLNGTNFGTAFYKSVPNKVLLDPGLTKDTITISGSSIAVTSAQVFVAIQHTYTSDLTLTLTAPNGQNRILSTSNGGAYDNGYLTIFDDATGDIVTSTTFLTPWSNYVKPQNAIGALGGSPTNGNWVLTINDAFTPDQGLLLGWGIRFNNLATNVTPIAGNIPNVYTLYQNYPNPFNPVTNIKFDLPKNGFVNMKIFDIAGREISTLVNEQMQAGTYNVRFDGSALASGTYFYRIQSGDFTQVKKMMLIK